MEISRAFGALTESVQRTFGPTATTITSSSYTLPLVAGVVGLLLVVMVVFAVVQMRQGSPTKLLKGPVDLFAPKSPIVVDRSTVKKDMGGSYTVAFYLRVDAVPDMRTEATPLFTWPGAWDLNYNAAHEELQWVIRETPSGPNTGPEKITLHKVPLQRWTQVTFAFEGRTFDMFVNGVLVKSHTLRNLPPSTSSSITIVPGGIMGQIAYVQLWPRRLTVSETGANYVDTSDSQGRPFLGPEFVNTLMNIQAPNLFCPSGNCTGSQPTATPSQTWEFPYA